MVAFKGILLGIIASSLLMTACGQRPARLVIETGGDENASPETNTNNSVNPPTSASPIATDSTNTTDPGKVPSGLELYSQRLPGEASTFTCATCHALKEDKGSPIVRAGHEIGTAALRTSWKNGKAPSLRDAVNVCIQDFMGAKAWPEDDAKWKNLKGFLEENAKGQVGQNLSFEIKAAPSPLPEGDAEKGQAAYLRSCGLCHGPKAEGTSQGPNLAGTKLSADAIADRVRSGPTKIKGARMPFFTEGRLSDEDLIDLVTYLKTSTEAVKAPVVDLPMDANLGLNFSVENAQKNCGKTHAMVGTKGKLSQFAHGVSGDVEVLDDCTIAFTNFNYDGNGIEVKVYTGKNGVYRSGKAISRDIYRPSKEFKNTKAFFRLPQGVTLDDFDGISIWCVAVGFSFGDTIFK